MKFGNWQYSKNSIRERIHINKDIDFVWPFLGLSDKIFFNQVFPSLHSLSCVLLQFYCMKESLENTASNDGLILG